MTNLPSHVAEQYRTEEEEDCLCDNQEKLEKLNHWSYKTGHGVIQ